MRLKAANLIKGLMIFMLCVGAGYAMAATVTRDHCLSELRQIKTENQNRMVEIQSRLKILLSGSPGANLGLSLAPSLPNVEREIEDLSQQHKELVLKQTFLDRLMFEIDSRFKGGDLRQFLHVQLLSMAQTDLLDSSGEKKMWKFLTYLAQALEGMPERDADPLTFIEGYLKASTITNPTKPEGYLKSLNYTNGKESVAARPVDRESLGEAVEQKIEQMEPLKN